MENKLTKKKNGQMFCGVCSGIADYFNIDVTIVRLLFAASTVAGGVGSIIYIAGILIMPDDNSSI